jgi:GH25 family lysozyme M1 (1,4-beta-N-acetylmuramidase)
MPDPSPFARGQDVAGDNQPLDQMHYQDWAQLGFCYGWIELVRSGQVIAGAKAHRKAMRAAGYLTGAYAAIAPGDMEGQARTFLSLAPAGDELPDMLDVETGGLTLADVRAWCDVHDAETARGLVIYTRNFLWGDLIKSQPGDRIKHFKKYKLVIAAYFHDVSDTDAHGHPQSQPMDAASVARRSNPPPASDGLPTLPAPWTVDDLLSWQHTGHGSLAGFDNFLDLHVARASAADFRKLFTGGGRGARGTGGTRRTIIEVTPPPQPASTAPPQPAAPPLVPLVAKGSKLGIGQVLNGPALQFVRQAHDQGAPLAGAFGMDNAGVAIDARGLVLFRLTRIVQGDTEAAPGMDDNPSDDSLRHRAAQQVDLYVHRLNTEEKAAAGFILPWNEPRPATVAG